MKVLFAVLLLSAALVASDPIKDDVAAKEEPSAITDLKDTEDLEPSETIFAKKLFLAALLKKAAIGAVIGSAGGLIGGGGGGGGGYEEGGSSGPSYGYGRPIITGSLQYSAPAPVNNYEYSRPAPAINYEYSRPAPVNNYEYSRPAPVVNYEYSRPAPVNNYEFSRPAPVSNYEYSAPAPPPPPRINYVEPAPSRGYNYNSGYNGGQKTGYIIFGLNANGGGNNYNSRPAPLPQPAPAPVNYGGYSNNFVNEGSYVQAPVQQPRPVQIQAEIQAPAPIQIPLSVNIVPHTVNNGNYGGYSGGYSGGYAGNSVVPAGNIRGSAYGGQQVQVLNPHSAPAPVQNTITTSITETGSGIGYEYGAPPPNNVDLSQNGHINSEALVTVPCPQNNDNVN